MFVKLASSAACTSLAVAMLVLNPALIRSAPAAGGGGSDTPPSKLELARQSLEKGDYQAASTELMRLNKEDPKDADVLNLLGYSQRKLGRLDAAREYYLQALALEPKHRGANEYLGELYLQEGDLPKAEARLAVLDDACFFPCEEYTELKEAVAKYKTEKGIK